MPKPLQKGKLTTMTAKSHGGVSSNAHAVTLRSLLGPFAERADMRR
jgi:hypothetical protein